MLISLEPPSHFHKLEDDYRAPPRRTPLPRREVRRWMLEELRVAKKQFAQDSECA